MSATELQTISISPVDSLKDSDKVSPQVYILLFLKPATEEGGNHFQFYYKRVVFVIFEQGDVALVENEDEAVVPIESMGGFFIKHGTFMGTENEISDSSDAAGNDSDYDTDLDIEGE